MEFLLSNFPPIKTTESKTFFEVFSDLVPKTMYLDIAVGYITADSLLGLLKLVKSYQNLREINLIIGMHYFDLFSKQEYDAACKLNNYLKEAQRGEVRLVTTFKYHGKLYCFGNESGSFAGIIGSNNLSSIINGGARVYESAILIDDSKYVSQMKRFIADLSNKSADNIADLEIIKFKKTNDALENQEGVNKVSSFDIDACKENLTDIRFEIPIKSYEEAPCSNLHTSFGKGRKGKNGRIVLRDWYEVELIVPKSIAMCKGYPKARTPESTFTVLTDDGWKFDCKVSGDSNKNFRSKDDLKILGKWIKGRLENANLLKSGGKVTNEILDNYGRHSFTLVKTTEKGLWFLDFSQNNSQE